MENEEEEPQKAFSDSSSVVVLGQEDDYNMDYDEGLCCITGGEEAYEQE